MISEVLAALSFGLKMWILGRREQPLWLFFYVGAMMMTAALEWPTKWEFGPDSQAYFAVWAFCTGLVLLAVFCVVWEHIRLAQFRLRGVVLAGLIALIPARMGYLADPGTYTAADKLVTAEGSLLLLAGLLVGATANRSERPAISRILAVLWMLQSAFDWGWILHWPEWNEASWVLGPSLGLVSFAAIAYCLRRVSREATA